MNTKEIGEIRRRQKRERSNMTHIYGCYVNDNKEIISQFKQSVGMMSENEAEKYFALFRRSLGGTIGKNLIDVSFSTAQVAGGSPEHKLLMDLRNSKLQDEQLREQLCRKIIDSLSMDESYVILLGSETYDVPFKSREGEMQADSSEESYTYLMCAICPVKQTKATLHYIPETREFRDGNMVNVITAPEIGFLFPAFDNRSTNIYNALYYNKNVKDNHEALATAIFNAPIPMAANSQKQSFAALLSNSLEEECSMDVVQSVHEQLCQQIAMHKESRVADALLIDKAQVKDTLEGCGVSEGRIAKFSIDFDETFGFEAQLHPKNIIDDKKIEIATPDVIIKVAPDRGDLVETRVLGGVEYILIRADESVEVNGVDIAIGKKEAASV